MPLRTADDLKQGDVLAGKYRIDRVIGVGGMGVVAAALHLELGTLVAIKLLLSEEIATDDLIERFSREARAASRLRGEHAVRVFDVGKHSDGTPYMVMEYLVGEDLGAALARQGPLDVSAAVGLVVQACEAVAEAHSIGVIHRDLKPSNLFLTRRVDGSLLVKVLDFGIAKRVETDALGSLTGKLIVGSPSYMSPEQMRPSAAIDARADIWSLGVCLYELTTGNLPFAGDSSLETCAIVLKDEPRPPVALRPQIPFELSQVIMRCLRKDPDHRFRDVGELAEALESFASPPDGAAAPRIRLVLQTRSAYEHAISSASSVLLDARVEPGPGMDARKPVRRTLAVGVATAAVLGLALATAVWMRPRPRSIAVARPESTVPAVATTAVHVPAVVQFEELPIAASTEHGASGSQGTPTKRTTPLPSRAAENVGSSVARGAHLATTAAVSTPPPVTEPERPAPAATPLSVSVVPSFAPPSVASVPPVATKPPFAIESARVQIGAPGNVVGTTASNIGRALARATPRMTACYREALPRMSAPFEGKGTLHIESDEEGVITAAQMAGPFAGAVGPCVAAAVRGLTIPSVDTGRARADVPIVLTAR